MLEECIHSPWTLWPWILCKLSLPLKACSRNDISRLQYDFFTKKWHPLDVFVLLFKLMFLSWVSRNKSSALKLKFLYSNQQEKFIFIKILIYMSPKTKPQFSWNILFSENLKGKYHKQKALDIKWKNSCWDISYWINPQQIINSSLTLLMNFQKYCRTISSFHFGSLKTCKPPSQWIWNYFDNPLVNKVPKLNK